LRRRRCGFRRLHRMNARRWRCRRDGHFGGRSRLGRGRRCCTRWRRGMRDGRRLRRHHFGPARRRGHMRRRWRLRGHCVGKGRRRLMYRRLDRGRRAAEHRTERLQARLAEIGVNGRRSAAAAPRGHPGGVRRRVRAWGRLPRGLHAAPLFQRQLAAAAFAKISRRNRIYLTFDTAHSVSPGA
jgi:hypothetical protein